jgi:hypothetical protein
MLFSMSSATRGLHIVETPDSSEYAVGINGKLWQTYNGQYPQIDWSSDIFDCYNQMPGGILLNLYLNTDLVGTPVPAPQVSSFLAGFSADGTIERSGNTFTMDASAKAESVGFFRSPGGLDASTGGDVVINVHGIAVWAFDGGFATENNRTVTVQGNPQDMLVMVAQSSGPLGMKFDGGLHSPIVPVILVSDQQININSAPSGNFSTTMGWVSMYAPRVEIQGPRYRSGYTYLFYHRAAYPYAEHSLDNLFDRHALPNVNGPRNSLAYRPGTWRELPNN